MDFQRRPETPVDLGIVGVGAIAEAIITGLCEGEDTASSIRLSPRSAGRASRLAARYPSVQVTDSNQADVEQADVLLLCVRPQDAPAALSPRRTGSSERSSPPSAASGRSTTSARSMCCLRPPPRSPRTSPIWT